MNGRKKMWLLTATAILAVMVILAIITLTSQKTAPSENRRSGTMRIVSLAPSVTEIVFALGIGDSLIGVTKYCDWPQSAKQIERIGGLGLPNMERLLALRPDIVIAAGLDRNETKKALGASGIRILDVQIRSFEEMFDAIRQIGQETNRPAQAQGLITSLRADLDATARRYAKIPNDRRTRVFVELWHDPLTTAGRASFLNDVIGHAGGVNVAGELPLPHPRISAEMVIQWNPDVIITAYMGHPGKTAAQMANRIGWADIRAVKNGQIIDDIPAELLLRPGPRLVEGVKVLSQRLYPSPVTAAPAAGGSERAHP